MYKIIIYYFCKHIYSNIKSLTYNIPLLCIFSDPTQILQNKIWTEWLLYSLYCCRKGFSLFEVFIGFEYEYG